MATLRDLLHSNDNGHKPTNDSGFYAVAYLRCSRDDSDEQAQRADIESYALRQGVVIAEWYEDHGVRANSEVDRVAFHRLLERAKSDRCVKWVYVREDSRFSRNKTKARRWKEELRQHGVTVVNVSAPFDSNSISGTLMESINETLPEVNSRQCRDWTMTRMRHHCQQIADPNRPELGK